MKPNRLPKPLPLLAYLFVVGMGAFGLWRQEQLLQDDKAARCVSAWETRQDIRSAIAGAATVPVEALIAVVQDAEPAQVDAYRAEAARRIEAATDQLLDPTCDLDAARQRLD